jgi:quercetin dioxygenase-like cupin family protein
MPYQHDEPGKALILEGEISLRPADGETTYAVGEIFHLLPNEPH